MTYPLELLEEYFLQIKNVKDKAIENNLEEKELNKIKDIYNKYYISIKILEYSLQQEIINKGLVLNGVTKLLEDKEKNITSLKKQLSKISNNPESYKA